MKTLYIDCQMGAAGDMLTAALLELIPDKKGMIDQLNAIGIPGVEYAIEESKKCGITGTHVRVIVDGQEESEEMHEHHHEHEHTHHSHGGHSHTSLHDIEHIVKDHLTLPAKVADDVMSVYKIIAEAESHAHGVPVTDIHFHEVGTMDAVADITAVCLLMYVIAPERVIVSPINVGSGQVKCAHGILPVPAPATAHILRNIPSYSGEIKSELCTPTGAALIKFFATQYGNMPIMRTETIGYGMGKKDFSAANCVRIMLGDTDELSKVSEPSNDTITMLSCNVDDMTGEQVGYAVSVFQDAGALDVYTINISMKKNRPGIMINVLVNNCDVDKMVSLIFKNTTTLGIRKNQCERFTLDRKIYTVHTQFGDVREKISNGYGVEKCKYEYEDVAKVASNSGLSYQEVVDIIRSEE